MLEPNPLNSEKKFDSKLGFKRRDISTYLQKIRDKKNIEYVSPEGRPFFAKYCNLQEGRRNTVAGLVNEKKILDKLEDTGVTPRPGDIKLYPNHENPQRARFLMEVLDAVPFSSEEIDRNSDITQIFATEVIMTSAKAYQTIHNRNVLHVDVVLRNLMLKNGQSEKELKAYLVDFELGLDLDRADEGEIEQAVKWYAGADPACLLEDGEFDESMLKKAEVFQWARMMCEWLLGPSYKWDDLGLPSEEEMSEQQKVAAEVLKQKAVDRAKRYHQSREKNKDAGEAGSLEDDIRWELENSYRYELAEALLADSLEQRLSKRGMDLDDKTINFLKKALSLDLHERPENFDALNKPAKNLVKS